MSVNACTNQRQTPRDGQKHANSLNPFGVCEYCMGIFTAFQTAKLRHRALFQCLPCSNVWLAFLIQNASACTARHVLLVCPTLQQKPCHLFCQGCRSVSHFYMATCIFSVMGIMADSLNVLQVAIPALRQPMSGWNQCFSILLLSG